MIQGKEKASLGTKSTNAFCTEPSRYRFQRTAKEKHIHLLSPKTRQHHYHTETTSNKLLSDISPPKTLSMQINPLRPRSLMHRPLITQRNNMSPNIAHQTMRPTNNDAALSPRLLE